MSFKKSGEKTGVSAAKAVAGADITPEMLVAINSFALIKLTEDDVYVRKFLLAHNAIDRDRERFSEDILEDFAATLPGKSLLMGHKRPDPGKGLFFAAHTEEMTPEQFKALTGDEAKLPEGVTKVKVLIALAYMVKAGFNDELMQNIDAGIFRHVSIHFAASDLVAIQKEVEGPVLFYEFKAPGEAREGSFVWLGAQPGATAQKAQEDVENDKTEGGKKDMKEFLKQLSEKLGKEFSDAAAVISAYGTMAESLKQAEDEVVKMEPFAKLGKKYHEGLVDEFVKAKAKLGEVEADDDAKTKLKAVAGGLDINYLEGEVEALQKRVAEKFPDKSQLDGQEPDKARDKSTGSDDGLLDPENENKKKED